VKVTTKPPEPVKPTVVVEMTWEEAESLRNAIRATQEGFVWGQYGGVLDELRRKIRDVVGNS
jgi:hypothetical protein